ncbi:MAG: hypothetical protein OXE86_11245 [Alphaproteobacteria bacterium]|nr:hypothetical protein [Alphaproteobacteria bacterium]
MDQDGTEARGGWSELRLRSGVPGWFDPGTLYLPHRPQDGPARIEALTVEGERGWITITSQADARQVAGALAEQAEFGLTGLGLERLELLTGKGWLDIEASGVLTGVIVSDGGEETHLSGRVDISRPGAPAPGVREIPDPEGIGVLGLRKRGGLRVFRLITAGPEPEPGGPDGDRAPWAEP